MRLRSFHGETLAAAMQQVRTVLGDAAIIVATHEDAKGGIRITAAADDGGDYAKKNIGNTKPYPDRPEPGAWDEKEANEADAQDGIEIMANALLRHHISHSLAEKMLGYASAFAEQDALVILAAALEKTVRFAGLFDPYGGGAPYPAICLVGPPGTGKTLSLAKLATARVLARQQVGVITSDVVRAGAIEQLSAYTRLLKLPLLEVEDGHALQDALATYQQNGQPPGLVLVDSTGRNPYSASDMQGLKTLLDTARVEPVLVLQAGLDGAEARDIAEAFIALGVRKLICTKLDMARRLGSLVELAHDTGLACCAFSLSAKATEALKPCNPVALAQLLLPPEIVAAALKKITAETTALHTDARK